MSVLFGYGQIKQHQKVLMTKIQFIAETEYAQKLVPYPEPASSDKPRWWRATPRFKRNETTAGLDDWGDNTTNTTMKACIPFQDAMNFGYVWKLPCDLEFKKTPEGNFIIKWREFINPVTSHPQDEFPLLPAPMGGSSNQVFKFQCEFRIQTPKGYSVFFTHPVNRYDLPFRTFSGVVDTDNYDLPVNFPFQIIDPVKDSYILEAGTPIVQIIPFKRQNWKSVKTSDTDIWSARKRNLNFAKKIVASYQKFYWVKKTYL